METTDPISPPTFEITKERAQLDTLIQEWTQEADNVKTRRKIRENKKNVEEERRRGTILSDETIIPDRTINTNIKRGRSPYINYITQSKRLLITEDVDDPKLYTESLELWFTKGMRYPRWKIPWFRLIDCVATHGGAAVEVMYDDTKPLNCMIEYIPRESLIFHKSTKNLQASPRILRLYEVTTLQLEEFRQTYEFEEEIVKKLLDIHKDNKQFIKIYRVLLKKDGVVWNAWYAPDENINWLRAPRPHDIGLFEFDRRNVRDLIATIGIDGWEQVKIEYAQPKLLSQYPIFWFPFELTENEVLLEGQGRVALDLHVQEALTHLLTNTVNASTRASNFYPTAEGEPGSDSKLRELGPLKPGVVMNGKITTFQPAWPNNIILAVTQVLDQRKAQETGNQDFASIARKDANKTATEMQLATQQAAELSTTDLDIFSSPFLDVYALCFEIARQQAIFGLCKPPPDATLLFGDYHLTPAGDVEVKQREEDKQNAKEFFNLVRGTPLAEKIFVFLLQRFFPDEADDWIAILNSPDKDQLIAQLLNIVQNVPTDELTPEQRTALQAIIISAQNVVGAGNDAGVPQSSSQPANAVATPGNAPQQAVAG